MQVRESRGQSPSYSRNFQKLGKELMSVDEIAVMDGGKCILQVRGERPFLSDKFDIMKHKNYRQLADFSDKNLFNVEKFLSTKLKLKPDDDYDVFEFDLSDEQPE